MRVKVNQENRRLLDEKQEMRSKCKNRGFPRGARRECYTLAALDGTNVLRKVSTRIIPRPLEALKTLD